MDDQFYTTLATDIGRVLTTGPKAEAMLVALERYESPRTSAGASQTDDDEEALLPLALRTKARGPAENMGNWCARNIAEARAPFEPWEEILSGVKAGQWKTQKELAATHHKPAQWVTALKRVVVAQGVMSRAEWEACFSRYTGNRGVKGERAQAAAAAQTEQHTHNTKETRQP
jgi:hypothetical protein